MEMRTCSTEVNFSFHFSTFPPPRPGCSRRAQLWAHSQLTEDPGLCFLGSSGNIERCLDCIIKNKEFSKVTVVQWGDIIIKGEFGGRKKVFPDTCLSTELYFHYRHRGLQLVVENWKHTYRIFGLVDH